MKGLPYKIMSKSKTQPNHCIYANRTTTAGLEFRFFGLHTANVEFNFPSFWGTKINHLQK
jgi:hypothetical protein